MKKPRFQNGERVKIVDPPGISRPRRTGTIVRFWYPYDQYRILWDSGMETNVWGRDLESLGRLPLQEQKP